MTTWASFDLFSYDTISCGAYTDDQGVDSLIVIIQIG